MAKYTTGQVYGQVYDQPYGQVYQAKPRHPLYCFSFWDFGRGGLLLTQFIAWCRSCTVVSKICQQLHVKVQGFVISIVKLHWVGRVIDFDFENEL